MMRLRFGKVALALILSISGCLDWNSLQQGRCGDGFVGTEESCDDSNSRDGDGCSARCQMEPAFCGDGRLNGSEGCDDANASNSDACTASCIAARCGDGVLWEFIEECDDGNTESNDLCSANCEFERSVEPPPELCGNGQQDPDEACDDGNESNMDLCLNGCSRATCGDGFVRQGVEECDDGNLNNNDGCTRACMQCQLEGESHFRTANSHCYILHPEPLSREQARSACHARGADLWSVNSEDEESNVLLRLKAANGTYWIGLNRSGTTLSWVTAEPTRYQNFANGEPGTASTCVSLTLAANASEWRSAGCANELPFVCERNPPFTFANTHHAYRVITAQANFADARQRCGYLGGYLATLEDAEELSFVAARVAPRVWLGATDMDLEGTFRWLSGAAVDPALFQEGQPDNLNGNQNCLFLNTDAIDDAFCDVARSYVCEFE